MKKSTVQAILKKTDLMTVRTHEMSGLMNDFTKQLAFTLKENMYSMIKDLAIRFFSSLFSGRP